MFHSLFCFLIYRFALYGEMPFIANQFGRGLKPNFTWNDPIQISSHLWWREASSGSRFSVFENRWENWSTECRTWRVWTCQDVTTCQSRPSTARSLGACPSWRSWTCRSAKKSATTASAGSPPTANIWKSLIWVDAVKWQITASSWFLGASKTWRN